MENDYEKKVIDFLGDEKKSSTEITSHVGRDYYFVLKLLNKMLDDGDIEKIVLGKSTFWGVKDV